MCVRDNKLWNVKLESSAEVHCVCPLRTGISGLKDDAEQRRTGKLCFYVRLGGSKPSVFEGMRGSSFVLAMSTCLYT